MGKKDFAITRRSVVSLAIIVGVISLACLLLLEFGKAHVWEWAYSAGINVFGVLFGVAVVSLGWEFFVRRSHSTDLRHYLRLGASVGQSGLQEITPQSRLRWNDLLERASVVTVLTDSTEWLDRNSFSLLDRARERGVTVTVAVPALEGEFLKNRAFAMSSDLERLKEQIQDTVDRVARQWRSAAGTGKPLHSGSKLSVVEHPYDVPYDIVTVDGMTLIALSAPGAASGTSDRLTIEFDQDSLEYPTNFLRTHIAGLEHLPRLEEVTP